MKKVFFLRNVVKLDDVVFGKWNENARVWLFNLKKSINNGVFKTWLFEDNNKVVKDQAYWMSEQGTKQTKTSKEFWESDENAMLLRCVEIQTSQLMMNCSPGQETRTITKNADSLSKVLPMCPTPFLFNRRLMVSS